MARKCYFFDVTRKLLEERLEQVRAGVKPEWTDLRHFFYICRNKFLREHPEFDEVDSTAKKIYIAWQERVKSWCVKHVDDFGTTKDLYWRVREGLNLWAEGKATCDGESGDFLITPDKRKRASEKCSFVLICEKKTVSRELLENLRKEGYKINLISTGGFSPSDVTEAVLEAMAGIDDDDEENFYFLLLHDYDLDGVLIYLDLNKHFQGVLDVGVNGQFIDHLVKSGLVKYLKDSVELDLRLIEENRINRKDFVNPTERDYKIIPTKQRIIENDNYTEEDFDYLYGEPFEVMVKGKLKTYHRGKRIEIDSIHVEHGIQPFIEYIKHIIKVRCKYWDLTRTGTEEFELEEPDNPFELAVSSLEYDMSKVCYEAFMRIIEPVEMVKNFVETASGEFFKEFNELKAENGIERDEDKQYQKIGSYTLNRTELEKLREEYNEGFEREYVPYFEDELDELNQRVHNYCGERIGAEDVVQAEFNELQGEVNSKSQNDGEAENFEEELYLIDWDEEKFRELKAPDIKDMIKTVIAKLQEQLKEMR